MAKIVLDKEEVKLYRKQNKEGAELRKSIYEAAMQIAGDLGGWGIDLVDKKGNDLSTGEYEYQYGRPKPEPKVVIKDERTLPTEIIKR